MAQKAAVVILPWPPKALHAHAKGHWRPKAKATRSYREIAYWAAKAAKVPRTPTATLTITYAPPDRRRRDAQNMPSMLKAAIDGIADAMGCDDNGFQVQYPNGFDEPVNNGQIRIEVTE